MALEIDRIKAICFDIDGTLSDTDDQFVAKLASWLRWLQFFRKNFDVTHLARRIVMGTETPANLLYGIPDILGIDSLFNTISERIHRLRHRGKKANFLLIPHVRELLGALHPHYPMAVVSARGELTTMQFIDQFDLHSYFQVIVTAQTCRHTKPFPDPILFAARQMEVAPENILMVGDTTVDILAAKKAGAQSIGVLCGFGEREELKKAGADLIVDTTSEIIHYLPPYGTQQKTGK